MDRMRMEKEGIAGLVIGRMPLGCRVVDGHAAPTDGSDGLFGMLNEPLPVRAGPNGQTTEADRAVAQRHPAGIGVDRTTDIEEVLVRWDGRDRVVREGDASNPARMDQDIATKEALRDADRQRVPGQVAKRGQLEHLAIHGHIVGLAFGGGLNAWADDRVHGIARRVEPAGLAEELDDIAAYL